MMTEFPMKHSIPVDDSTIAPDTGADGPYEVAPDIAVQRLAIVNVAFVGAPDGAWVLVDTGMPGTAGLIERAARARFGDRPPAAIILTHGHFDHVGALEHLVKEWRVPVYAHPLERPYLDGSSSYPPPDPRVGGGMMALMSPIFPRGPIDVSDALTMLPDDHTIPFMTGWRWVHTPGHTPGHVSLWRESDRTLIVGDAFVTTAQESVYAAATQRPELHGPPMYYTQDWDASRRSVEQLAELQPELVVTGHGRPMQGTEMRKALQRLAWEFDAIAVPDRGRYVETPAKVEDGSAYH